MLVVVVVVGGWNLEVVVGCFRLIRAVLFCCCLYITCLMRAASWGTRSTKFPPVMFLSGLSAQLHNNINPPASSSIGWLACLACLVCGRRVVDVFEGELAAA